MYDKIDAEKALKSLKESYTVTLDSIEEAKKEIKQIAKRHDDLKQSKSTATKIGVGLCVVFGFGLFLGFVSIVPLIVSAVLGITAGVVTDLKRKNYNKLMKENLIKLEKTKESIKRMETFNSSYTIPRIDQLQDIVHSNKPITKEQEDIICCWVEKPSQKNNDGEFSR